MNNDLDYSVRLNCKMSTLRRGRIIVVLLIIDPADQKGVLVFYGSYSVRTLLAWSNSWNTMFLFPLRDSSCYRVAPCSVLFRS